MSGYKLIEQKIIESEYDILRLDIIDWNRFHPWDYQNGELHFSDSPDFSGTLTRPNEYSARFWGDIGKVSARAFSDAQISMHAGDLWISIIGEDKQVIIETLVDIAKLHVESLIKRFPFLTK